MGFGGGGGKNAVRNEINVTPLVDVVLVLLIIFLVTMPILMKDMTLEIPRKAEPMTEEVSEAQVVVELGIDGFIKLNGDEVKKFELAEKLADVLKNRREKIVFVGFEDDVKYSEAVELMDLVKAGGALKVALKMKDEPAKDGEGAAPAPATPTP
jgi:biopolymer transport protein TolR